VTPRPGEPDRLAGGGEPVCPGQPAGHRQRGERPDPVQPRGQHPGAGQVPGGIKQLMPDHVHPGLQRLDHLQRGGHLQLPGRGQMGRGSPQRGYPLPGAQRSRAQGRGALVEQHRVDALHPGGVLAAQIMVGLQQRPAFQDVPGRDPALRQPALGQQHPQMPRVGLAGLGVPLAAARGSGAGRLGQVRRGAGRGQLLADIPPPGAPLDCERDVLPAGEPGQPGPQVRPVSRGDLAAPHLPGLGVEVVEGDLLPMNIQPAYDGHRDLLKLRKGRTRPMRIAYAVHRDARLSWGGLPASGRGLSSARPDACHLIVRCGFPSDRGTSQSRPGKIVLCSAYELFAVGAGIRGDPGGPGGNASSASIHD